ncbi:serine/threonine-protein kinase PrkC-like [Haliotis asinina]|uniref:serine/threonine-protein kinase PrkC-like n=1 Tax=Haliotis asinina TaxID=109174 RepID=UPI003532199C
MKVQVVSITFCFSLAVSAFNLNTTVCPRKAVPPSVLNFGFLDDGIPRDLHEFPPVLLNVNNVHVFDDKAGSGAQAELYTGRLLHTDEDVVVKVFDGAPLESIMHEATLMTYLQGVPHVPRFHGLLPMGPDILDLGIVMEYIPNGTTMYDLLLLGMLPDCDWINIAQQLSTALLEMHKRYVLFNDLHDKNIVVSWHGPMPMVYVVDFGDATFRKGNSFMQNFTQGPGNPFPSPEAHFGITTPASDVYSLGIIMAHIADYVNNKSFYTTIQQCLASDPNDRLPLYNLNDFLVDLYESTCMKTSAIWDYQLRS